MHRVVHHEIDRVIVAIEGVEPRPVEDLHPGNVGFLGLLLAPLLTFGPIFPIYAVFGPTQLTLILSAIPLFLGFPLAMSWAAYLNGDRRTVEIELEATAIRVDGASVPPGSIEVGAQHVTAPGLDLVPRPPLTGEVLDVVTHGIAAVRANALARAGGSVPPELDRLRRTESD